MGGAAAAPGSKTESSGAEVEDLDAGLICPCSALVKPMAHPGPLSLPISSRFEFSWPQTLSPSVSPSFPPITRQKPGHSMTSIHTIQDLGRLEGEALTPCYGVWVSRVGRRGLPIPLEGRPSGKAWISVVLASS